MVKYKHLLRLLFGVVFFCLLFWACKKKEGPTAGIDVHPDDTRLGLFSTDTFSIECFSQRLDSVRTDGQTMSTVGSYNDPEFGVVNSSFAAQVRLSLENIDVNELRTFAIDSVILALDYDGYYGSLDAQNIYVYEVNEDLLPDSAYFSNYKVSVVGTALGNLINHLPNPSKAHTEDGTEQPAQLRIPLDTAFGKRLFNAPALAYTSNEEFLKFFKGIQVKAVNPNQAVNTGAILSFDLNSEYSRLLVYYREPDGTRSFLEYLINDNSVTFNMSSTDYTGTPVESSFNDPNKGQQKLYIQSMGGVVTVVKIPHLKRILENGPVILNRAQFVASIEIGSNARFSPLFNLYPFGITDNNKIFDTPDRLEPYFDGALSSDNMYTITLTRYYQKVLDGEIDDQGIMIMELGEIFGRSILYGPSASQSPLKFVVSYTPIN